MTQITEDEINETFNRTAEPENSIESFISNLQSEIIKVTDVIDRGAQMSRLKEIAERYKGEDELISSIDFVERIKAQPPQLQMHTKFKGLDELLNGFRPGQLISISAVAKSGKTNFCMELTSNQSDYHPVWFPFEEGTEELVSKFLDRGETPPVFFVPAKIHTRTLKFIEKKIIEAVAKFDSKIFYIDNLDWIVDPRSGDHERMIQYACMELKRMAVDWNVCIVLIAHVRKLLSPTDQPNYNDIKGSSSVYQLSDTVIMMWRETKKEHGELIITSNVNISVQLNRKTGKTGNIKFQFDNGHYSEYDWSKTDKDLDEFDKVNKRDSKLI
jgi:replicative DNA helicase